MVVASPGNLCKINLNKRQRLRHFLNHKGIRSRFKCTSQSCAYIQKMVERRTYAMALVKADSSIVDEENQIANTFYQEGVVTEKVDMKTTLVSGSD